MVAEDNDVSVQEQAEEAADFTRGLVDALAVEADVSTRREDDDVVIVDIDGPDLGLLVGPKGATLHAIEELVRTVVQRRTEGHGARIHVDVGGYRAKRRAALERFALDLAEQVRESGEDRALEPMSASDRKVVHDAVATLDGVTTTSEGEEPRRRVVVRPGG
jgi:spoIIIJ-associated protein